MRWIARDTQKRMINWMEKMPNLKTVAAIPNKKAMQPPLREITNILFYVKSQRIRAVCNSTPKIFIKRKNIETALYPSE